MRCTIWPSNKINAVQTHCEPVCSLCQYKYSTRLNTWSHIIPCSNSFKSYSQLRRWGSLYGSNSNRKSMSYFFISFCIEVREILCYSGVFSFCGTLFPFISMTSACQHCFFEPSGNNCPRQPQHFWVQQC